MHSGFPACFAFLCSTPRNTNSPLDKSSSKESSRIKATNKANGSRRAAAARTRSLHKGEASSGRNTRKRAAGEGEERRQEPGRSRGHGLGQLEEALEAPRAAELEAVPLFRCGGAAQGCRTPNSPSPAPPSLPPWLPEALPAAPQGFGHPGNEFSAPARAVFSRG